MAAGEAKDHAGEHWESSQSAKTSRGPRTATVPECCTASKLHCFDTAATSLVGSTAASEESAEAAALPAAHPCPAAAAACNVDPIPAACGGGTSPGAIGRADLHECPGCGHGREK